MAAGKRHIESLLPFSYFSRKIRPCKPTAVCWVGGGYLAFIDKQRYYRISTSWEKNHILVRFWFGLKILKFLQDELRREVGTLQRI